MAKQIDLSILGGATSHAKYPSEMADTNDYEVIGNVIKPVPGGELKGRRIKIDAKKTSLFPDNPRNFAPKDDLADLLPLIEKTGGNSTAVDGRLVQGKVEVIAGSRRRDACLLLELPLVVDLWDDVTHEMACCIADYENSGRKGVDRIADSCYLMHRFNTLKRSDPAFTIEKFAAMYNNKRRNMTTIFGIAKLPEWVRNCALARSEWSIRQADTLRQYFEHVSSMYSEDELKARLNFPVKKPSQALSMFKMLAKEGAGESEKDKAAYKINVGKGGAVTVKIETKLNQEQQTKLDEFLKNLLA